MSGSNNPPPHKGKCNTSSAFSAAAEFKVASQEAAPLVTECSVAIAAAAECTDTNATDPNVEYKSPSRSQMTNVSRCPGAPRRLKYH